jgi:hypothetical protein
MPTLIERGCGLDVHQATVVDLMVDRLRARESPETNAHVQHYYTRAGRLREWLPLKATPMWRWRAREYIAQAR